MAKRDPKAYEEMSRDIEAGDITVRGPVEMGATLRMGRPAKDTESSGKTPAMTLRLPPTLRTLIGERVAAGEAQSESELIRTAVVEYLEHHPIGHAS